LGENVPRDVVAANLARLRLTEARRYIMRIRIVRLTENLLPATRAFNARLGANAPFRLPERLPTKRPDSVAISSGITWTHYVALENSEVRGGFLLMDQPAWINGTLDRASNYQSVLSEGIRDRKYGSVSVHMLKHIEQGPPHAFILGMGAAENPLPRLLKASGWTLHRVPFLFHVCNIRNFLREMRVFRKNRYWRMAAGMASISGAGWIGIRLLQARPVSSAVSLAGLKVDRVRAWESWADELWSRYRNHCSFAVVRDRTTLDQLYPLSQERLTVSLFSKGSSPIGWAACQDTPMENDQYFGNLRVATVLDAVAAPEFAALLARSLTRVLHASGADLVITNQGHSLWIRAFRGAGFLPAPSNYLLATSKKLSSAIRSGGGEERVHLTRGDGDGRIHL
jgi:hypothetical protein